MWKKRIDRAIKRFPTRAHGVAALATFVCGLALGFVPLFNVVGYESAAFFGVWSGVLATALTVHALRKGVVALPFQSDSEGAARGFGRLALWHLTLVLPGLVALVAHSLRVQTCDWVAGLLFWGLIPPGAVLLGQLSAFIAAALLGTDRRWRLWGAAFAFPLLDALVLIKQVALEPAIVGHHLFLGYFGGSIYDEALGVPNSLVVLRLLHLLLVVSALTALEAAHHLRQRRRAPWLVALALTAALAFAVGFGHRKDTGIHIDRGYIVSELGSVVETDHFLIYYPEAWREDVQVEELINDHEFRYHQMREFFGTDPVAGSGSKLRSFVYPNRDTKGRLMGGRDTMVAKIWLGEMHILWRGTGDHMLAHELAHLFTEPFGRGPLRLSTQRGVGVNMGLVEGVASAAEWSAEEFDPHEATAAMRRLEIAPDLRTIFGASGFWTQASGAAYTAMGSFVRYLIDYWGMEVFQVAYGKGDFEGAYGRPVEELIQEWEEYLDGIELTARQEEVARFRFDRPSIFGRVCARSLAEERRLARDDLRRGALVAARGRWERVLHAEPLNPGNHLEYANLLGRMEEYSLALEATAARPEGLSMVQTAQFLELEGDLLWRQGEVEGARRAYGEALELGVPVATERGLWMKKRLAEQGSDVGRALLVENPDATWTTYLMTTWRFDEPDAVEAAYLLGRRLWQSRHYEEAIGHLEAARGRFHEEVLDGEAELMLGHSFAFVGELAAARAVFEGLEASAVPRYREGARLWIARLDWMESAMQDVAE